MQAGLESCDSRYVCEILKRISGDRSHNYAQGIEQTQRYIEDPSVPSLGTQRFVLFWFVLLWSPSSCLCISLAHTHTPVSACLSLSHTHTHTLLSQLLFVLAVAVMATYANFT